MSKLRSSTWRQEDLIIKPGEVFDHVFLDTKPNVFWIQNLNPDSLYVSLSRIPTPTKYEYEIKPMKSDAFGRPLPASRIYILNASSQNMYITVFSTYQEFDIGLLKDLSVDIDTEALKGDGIINGVKTGVTIPVSFPSDVSLKVDNTNFASIKNSISSLYNYINGHWNDGTLVEANSGNIKAAITDVLSILNTGVPVNLTVPQSDIYAGEKVAATGTTNLVLTDNSIVTFLANDGDTDISITFKKDGKTNQTLTLKGGEALENMYINTYSMEIAPKVSGESISFRYLITNRF